MTFLEEQIVDTWNINHRTNMILMNHLTEDALQLTTSPRGGGKVGHQIAHMYNVRFWRLERIDKKHVEDLKVVKAKDQKSLEMLKTIHQKSAERMRQVILDALANEGRVKSFHRGIVPLIGYFIHHEGHHRGNIILTLKRCGYQLSNQLKYGIWAWNKI